MGGWGMGAEVWISLSVAPFLMERNYRLIPNGV